MNYLSERERDSLLQRLIQIEIAEKLERDYDAIRDLEHERRAVEKELSADSEDTHEPECERYVIMFLVCKLCGAEMTTAQGWWLCPACGHTVRNGVIELPVKNGEQ